MVRKKTQDDSQVVGSSPREFMSAIAQIADEKGISKEKVIETVEAALAAAYKRDYGKKGQRIRTEFNEISGETKFFLVKDVVDSTVREFIEEKDEAEELEKPEEKDEAEKLPRFNSERDITLEEARKIKKNAKIGDIIEIKLESKSDYGRIAAQTAKQVVIQKIREAERDVMYQEYKKKEGEIISGTIQRIEGRNVYVDIGKSVGVLFSSEQIEGEKYRIGARIKVYLLKVESDPKGPGITLSRSNPALVKKLFELEVPEIFAGTVEIKAVAREAGSRTKIAVASNEEGVDPIGSCVGQKGTRVQAVIDELIGEKIDIIEWNDNIEKFIASALSPAKVLSMVLNESQKSAQVTVPSDQLSLAIGRKGQNVRLAAKLTDWRIDIRADQAAEKVEEAKGTEEKKELTKNEEETEKTEKKSKKSKK